MRRVILTLLEALFRVLFTYDCDGAEKVPVTGPAVVAANHPSYLDPVLLSLRLARPIRFMAWDALFKVPLLGRLIRALGAFPVDVRKGRGGEAYERARAHVLAGEVVGIFPEGKRSRAGWMETTLREGAARLSLETGAPLVPASIAGAYRAWPHFQSLPRPARVKVRFHDPIDPLDYAALPAEQAQDALIAELRRRVERSLLPGVKADLRMNLLYARPSPWPRVHESAPFLALAALLFWKTRSLTATLPCYAYLAYLLADHFLIRQSRLAKWLRNASPFFVVLLVAPPTLRALGLPALPAGAALAAVLCGALFPYLYEHGRRAIGYVRGFVLASCLELLASLLAPSPAGAHVALPLFAAAYAWERRTVFWRYTAPLLAAYALAAAFMIGGGSDLVPHAAAGLLGWLLARILPERSAAPQAGGPAALGLGLR
jgi:1-acyl-sn-glycerol-3-phosphate acyltransferase